MKANPRPEAATMPGGVVKLADPAVRRAAADLEPLLRMADLARVLNCSRRGVEQMRSAGRLPRPDLHVGNRSPRWRPQTIRDWIERGGHL
jgi:predicted DNA-binding transcriptional regulator AlpA